MADGLHRPAAREHAQFARLPRLHRAPRTQHLADAALQPGRYRLVFSVSPYFRARGVVLPEPAFQDEVPLDFGIADATSHYHVPLLVSPWSYSTYRGS